MKKVTINNELDIKRIFGTKPSIHKYHRDRDGSKIIYDGFIVIIPKSGQYIVTDTCPDFIKTWKYALTWTCNSLIADARKHLGGDWEYGPLNLLRTFEYELVYPIPRPTRFYPVF